MPGTCWDNWHAVYPLVDELDPLGSLANSIDSGSEFTLYLVRQLSTGLAVGRFEFAGPPDGNGRVTFGYGLVPSARGRGLATEAVKVALEHVARHGARLAAQPSAPPTSPPGGCSPKRVW